MAPNFDHNSSLTESSLLSRIETGLDRALEELNLPPQKESHIKRQKYIYLFIDIETSQDENPVTYSWFKWGASCKAGPASQTFPQPLITHRASAESLIDIPLDEIERIFREDIEHLPLQDWWEKELLDFLEQFYIHYGKEEYRELYLANIELLRIMDDISVAIQHRRDPARVETYHDFLNRTSELKTQIKSLDHLEELYGYVEETTKLFEQVVKMLVNFEGQELERGHSTVFEELKKFYRDHVWLMIAHSISRFTAVGPNAELIRNDSKKELKYLVAQFEEAFNLNRRRTAAMELLPSIDASDREPDTEQNKMEEALDTLSDQRNNEDDTSYRQDRMISIARESMPDE